MNGEIKRVVDIIKRHRSVIMGAYPLKKIGIFGSIARGEQSRNSDIDILVEFLRPVGFITFIEIEEYLQKLLKRKVDLVTRSALKPLIKKEIIRQTIYI